MLPPTARLPTLQKLINDESYFVIHAPRQVGKTTAILGLAQQLTNSGNYTAAVVSVETGSPFNDNIPLAEEAILDAWQRALTRRLPPELHPPALTGNAVGNKIQHFLTQWAEASPRPIALFIDEIDSLQDQLLISVLRQLRDGFPDRPEYFPASLGLIGMRDVRDYKMAAGIELKVWRTGQADPLTKGLEQLAGYLNRLKQSSGWLVIFDRRQNAPALADRITTELVNTAAGYQITVIRL